MDNDSSRPAWENLLTAFLSAQRAGKPGADGDAVSGLFFADPWFVELVSRRTRQAVDAHAVPARWSEDLEQEISLLFVQKLEHTPDLHVNYEMVESHFGGLIWTIIDRLCSDAIQRLHKVYRPDSSLLKDVAGPSNWRLEVKVDLSMALDELPPLTREVMLLFDKGYTVKEIAELLEIKYWKAYDLFRRGIEFLQQRLRDDLRAGEDVNGTAEET